MIMFDDKLLIEEMRKQCVHGKHSSCHNELAENNSFVHHIDQHRHRST